MSETFYLGHTDYKPKPYTRINCIAKAINGAWKKQSLIDELPAVGKVFAPSLAWVEENQLIAITTETNPKQVDDGQDHYIVKDAFSPNLVIDYRSMTMEQIRYKLIEFGLARIAPYTDEVIVALSDTQCTVVKVKPHPIHGRYVASPGTIEIYAFNKAIFDGDTFNGQFLEIPQDTVGEFIGEITWKLDQELLSDVLNKVKQYDKIDLSKSKREEIISILNRALEITDENEDWDSINEWIVGYSQRVTLSLETPELIASTLFGMSSVREELERLKSQDREKYLNEEKSVIRQKIESELKDLNDHRETLNVEIKKNEENLTDLKGIVSECQDRISNLKSQLLYEIKQLNQTFGDIQDLDSQDNYQLLERFKKALQDTGKLISPFDSSIPPWSRGNEAKNISLINNLEFPTVLKEQAKKTGIPTEEMQLLDVSLRSGALTILPQQSAEILIPKYAQVITGGVFFREPLGPNILNLDDLWVQPSLGKSTGFARAWSTALQNPEQYHIIWLDGIQRTAVDLWLPSLVGVLYGSNRPKNLLIVATLANKFLDADRLWRDLPNFSIPIASEIENIRSKSLVQGIYKKDVQLTRLHIQESEFCIDKDIDEYRYEMEERKLAPHMLETEIRLYLAESLLVDEKSSISDRLKKYSTLRENGQKWLESLLKQ